MVVGSRRDSNLFNDTSSNIDVCVTMGNRKYSHGVLFQIMSFEGLSPWYLLMSLGFQYAGEFITREKREIMN